MITMRFLAEFVMRNPWYATIAAGVFAFFIITLPLSGAIIALVWLRLGASQGLRVMPIALIIGVYRFIELQSIDTLFAVIGAAALAQLLRANLGWAKVLTVSCIAAILFNFNYQWLDPALLEKMFNYLLTQPELTDGFDFNAFPSADLLFLFQQIFNSILTALNLLMLLGSLILARYWQATLYNPGGFKAEFQELVLPRWASLTCLLIIVGLLTNFYDLIALPTIYVFMLLPLIIVPCIIAALALIHAVFTLKNYNSFWLGLVYVALLFIQPYTSILLFIIALADSWLQFRTKLAPPPTSPY